MVRMQKLADGTDDEENSSEGKEEPTKRTSPPFSVSNKMDEY